MNGGLRPILESRKDLRTSETQPVTDSKLDGRRSPTEGIRRAAKKAVMGVSRLTSRPLTDAELSASALIVAPHADDETLACGATIARKRHAGARVTLLVLTDGSASHPRFIAPTELARVRSSELAQAADRLGIPPEDVVELKLPHGRLAHFRDEVIAALERLIAERRPAQVFTPTVWETDADHVVANRLTRRVLPLMDGAPVLFEYPVWFWDRWPFVPRPIKVREVLRAGAGTARAVVHLRDSVPAAGAGEAKRAALACYKSQVTHLTGDPNWPTLADVAGGEWLEMFSMPDERFHRVTEVKAESAGSRTPRAALAGLWKAARAYVKLLPREVKMPTADRDVLERVIFRELFCDPDVNAVMFVGCGGYTAWYPRLFRFRPGFRFSTIDPDPSQESFGAHGDHRVAPFDALLGAPHEHSRFDVVCINGVFNYGFDTEQQQREALLTARLLLRPGGRLLIGYSETNEHSDVDFSLIDESEWEPVHVPGLGERKHRTGSNLSHTFVCYRRQGR